MAFKRIILALFSIVLLLLNASCGNAEGNMLKTKHFKNLNVTMLYPDGFRETEGPSSYTFLNDAEDKMYIFSIYGQQTSEQVKQLIAAGMSNGGFSIAQKGNFATIENGLIATDVTVTTPQAKVDGYMLMKEVPGVGTYTYFTCATDAQAFEIQKQDLKKIALSTEIGNKVQSENTPQTTDAGSLSPKEYQDLLDDKVLRWSDRDRSTVSADDNTQSHGKVTYYQNVEKVKRFVFCSSGWAYFRYMSYGDQMTGDTGVAEYDKFSGNWRILCENGQCYIFMKDERDNRTRTWVINGVQGDMITIEGVTYRMTPDVNNERECQGDKFIVPGE